MPKEKRIKIFIVAPLNSIHTVRWIGQLSNQGWEIHLFPAEDIYSFHPELLHHIIHIPFSAYFHFMEKFRCKRVFDFFFRVYRDVRTRYGSKYFYKRLRRRIKMIKPHLIHSMETQGAGYLIAKVRSDYMSDFSFPLWWHTLWGSDIYLYRRLSAHRLRIEEVVKLCDFISADCMRDQKIVAAEYNVESKILALTHATCGFDIINLTRLQKSHIPTSERTIILLKGYQGWSGRALVGFRALCRCRDIIGKYKLVVFSNTSMEYQYNFYRKTPHMKYYSNISQKHELQLGLASVTVCQILFWRQWLWVHFQFNLTHLQQMSGLKMALEAYWYLQRTWRLLKRL
jgi:hypothetical protein